MNIGINFQRNKVNRLILVNGKTFLFRRQKLNEFNEPINDDFEEIEVRGIYHEVSGYVTKNANDNSVTRSKPQPMILCTVEEAAMLKKNDVLVFNGRKYIVVDFMNLNEYDICADVSLEVFENG